MGQKLPHRQRKLFQSLRLMLLRQLDEFGEGLRIVNRNIGQRLAIEADHRIDQTRDELAIRACPAFGRQR